MTGAAVGGTVIGAAGIITNDDDLLDIAGDAFKECGKAAKKLGKDAVCTGDAVLNGVPVVGHAKGVIHGICGDEEGAKRALLSANRTTGVIGGALAGSLAGPAGAVAGGIAGGTAMDGVQTGVASAVEGKYCPQGQVAAITQVVKAKNSEEVVEGIVGATVSPVMDGLTGFTVYKAAGTSIRSSKLEAQANVMLEQAEDAMWKGNLPDAKVMKMYDAAAKLNKEAMSMKYQTVYTKAGVQEIPIPQQKVVFVPGQQNEYDNDNGEEEEDEDRNRKKVYMKVFYVNAQSIKNTRANADKVLWVKRHIGRQRPHIVAVVETWLTSGESDWDVLHSLGLEGYQLFRADRSDRHPDGTIRRGGGMILAFKAGIDARLVHQYRDNFMSVVIQHYFNCSECAGSSSKEYAFGLVYRRPGPYTTGQTRDEFNQMEHDLWQNVLPEIRRRALSTSGAVLVGDFNFSIRVPGHPVWNFLPPRNQDSGTTEEPSSAYERGLLHQIEACGMSQQVNQATHADGNTLDLIFCTPEFVKRIFNAGNINVNPTTTRQDHCMLQFKLFLGYDCDKSS